MRLRAYKPVRGAAGFDARSRVARPARNAVCLLCSRVARPRRATRFVCCARAVRAPGAQRGLRAVLAQHARSALCLLCSRVARPARDAFYFFFCVRAVRASRGFAVHIMSALNMLSSPLNARCAPSALRGFVVAESTHAFVFKTPRFS